PPREIGKEGKRKKLEDGGNAEHHTTREVPPREPGGPGAREQKQQNRVHGAGHGADDQREEGGEHGDQAKQLAAPGPADLAVDDQEAGQDGELDTAEPEPDREVAWQPGERDQGGGEGRRIEIT